MLELKAWSEMDNIKQKYPDGAVYKGQFANGFEHGQGSMTYPDRGYFEGRFRFGRRDGPGMFAPPSGPTERGTFKDKHVYYNFPKTLRFWSSKRK